MEPEPVARILVAGEVRGEVARQFKHVDDVAEQLGITKSAASKKLNGWRAFSPDELATLADWLGVTVDHFVPRTRAAAS
jgi:transcriptional regulator with XRE-family HTH domain